MPTESQHKKCEPRHYTEYIQLISIVSSSHSHHTSPFPHYPCTLQIEYRKREIVGVIVGKRAEPETGIRPEMRGRSEDGVTRSGWRRAVEDPARLICRFCHHMVEVTGSSRTISSITSGAAIGEALVGNSLSMAPAPVIVGAPQLQLWFRFRSSEECDRSMAHALSLLEPKRHG